MNTCAPQPYSSTHCVQPHTRTHVVALLVPTVPTTSTNPQSKQQGARQRIHKPTKPSTRSQTTASYIPRAAVHQLHQRRPAWWRAPPGTSTCPGGSAALCVYHDWLPGAALACGQSSFSVYVWQAHADGCPDPHKGGLCVCLLRCHDSRFQHTVSSACTTSCVHAVCAYLFAQSSSSEHDHQHTTISTRPSAHDHEQRILYLGAHACTNSRTAATAWPLVVPRVLVLCLSASSLTDSVHARLSSWASCMLEPCTM